MISKSHIRTQMKELANTDLPLASSSETDDYPKMEQDVITERLRQARLSWVHPNFAKIPECDR